MWSQNDNFKKLQNGNLNVTLVRKQKDQGIKESKVKSKLRENIGNRMLGVNIDEEQWGKLSSFLTLFIPAALQDLVQVSF
jgi:hypothetical protein